jgi:hypothetical protein
MIWDWVFTGKGMLLADVAVTTGETEADRSQATSRNPATRITSIMA